MKKIYKKPVIETTVSLTSAVLLAKAIMEKSSSVDFTIGETEMPSALVTKMIVDGVVSGIQEVREND